MTVHGERRGEREPQLTDAVSVCIDFERLARIKRKLSFACLEQSTVVDESLTWRCSSDQTQRYRPSRFIIV